MRARTAFVSLMLCVLALQSSPTAHAGEAEHMVPGQRCYGEISAPGEADRYLIDAVKDSLLTVKLKPWKGHGIISRIALTSPSGGQINLALFSKYPKKGAAHTVAKVPLLEHGRERHDREL